MFVWSFYNRLRWINKCSRAVCQRMVYNCLQTMVAAKQKTPAITGALQRQRKKY